MNELHRPVAPRRAGRRAAAGLLGLALALGPALPAAAHGPSLDQARRALAAVPGGGTPCAGPGGALPGGGVSSANVRLLCNFPETALISGAFSVDGKYFYASSTDSISVFDATDPRRPTLAGTLPNLVFENEAMTYGEQRASDGTLTRFVLVGVDLFNVAPTTPQNSNVNGRQVLVIDVTDPAAPRVRSRVNVTTSTHTVQCVDPTDCTVAYTAGTGGSFSVVDLTDLSAPVDAGKRSSAAAGPNPIFRSGAGHYWDFDAAGIGWHTGSGGVVAYDVTSPLAPVALQAGNAQSLQTPYNDFIFHNSMRPNADKFVPDAEPSIANGNILLVTEEDYANDGDEIVCSEAGSFQTWYVKDLDGAAYRLGNPTGVPAQGSISPLDITNAPDEFGGGTSGGAGGFCSAHWFDVSSDGIVAQGYYQQGLHLLDVRDPANISQLGYFTAAGSEVWDAYFAPERDTDGNPTGRKSNIIYVADFVRGLDVVELDLDAAPNPVVPEVPYTVALGLAAAAVMGAGVVARRRRLA